GGVAAIELRDGLAEFGAGRLRLALLPEGPDLEARDASNDQQRHSQRIDAVFVPQLFVAVLADGLVHLAKKITVAHWRRTLLSWRDAQVSERVARSVVC